VGKDDGKRQLGKPWRRWEDSIKWVLKKSFGMAWTALMWLKTRTRGQKLSISINCRNSLAQIIN